MTDLIDAVWGEGDDGYNYNGTDWSIVTSRRDALGADLVSVLVDIGDGDGSLVTGIGDCPTEYQYILPNYCYSCCAIADVAADHTLTHEIGHNMGCDHPDKSLVNVSMISPGPGVFEYSAGYHFTAKGTKYYTIMAYNFDGFGNYYTSCPYFSSPSYQYNGVTVGDTYHDNTSTIAATYAKVAAFRQLVADKCTISFDGNGGSSPSGFTRNKGEALGSLPTTTWSGHTFAGWWTARSGGTVSPTSKRVDYCATYTLPTPTWSGHTFNGWHTEKTGGTKVASPAKCTGNKTLYAHWTATGPGFTTGGDANWTKQSDGSWKSGKITDGQVTWIETTVSGPGSFSFDWDVECEADYDGLQFYIIIQGAAKTLVQSISGRERWRTYGSGELPSGTRTLRWEFFKDDEDSYGEDCGWIRNFKWTPKEYKISYNANGGTVSPAYKMVGYCKTYGDLPTPTWGGHDFQGWFTAKTGGTQVTASTKCTGNATIYAQWKIKQYKLTFNANGGTVSPGYKMVDYCAAYGELAEPTWSGHTFAGWWTAANGGVPVGRATKCTGNVTVYARWANSTLNGYSLGGDADWFNVGGGTVWNSGPIGDNQQSWMMAETYGSGTYVFDWNVTSEKNCDFLTVYVDGVKLEAISGSTEWVTKEVILTGNYWHQIFWVYSKDESNSLGADRGRLCNLKWNAK